jgi:polysaccharide export outer membrane protein
MKPAATTEWTAPRPSAGVDYQVGCPDVLTIEVSGPNALQTRRTIGADGRIDLDGQSRVRVEGRSPVQVAALLAAELGTDADKVTVRVAEYRSQQVFLFAQEAGWQRSVPYSGQETVYELLRRAGGITRGAEPNDVYVVRAHIADGGRPQVYHVDLRAIVAGRNSKTNLRVLPNDQIYVGETRQTRIERIIPPWLRPLYHAVCR